MSRPSSYNWEGREKSAGQICSEDLGTAELTFKTNPGKSRSRGVKTKVTPLLEPEVKPGMRNCLFWQGMDTIQKKVKQIEKKTRNASLWTAGFSHQSLTCLSKLICPSWTMFAGTNPASLTNSQGQGCFGKAHLPFTSHDSTHLVFLPVSTSSFTSQSKENFVCHGHQAACQAILSSARSHWSLPFAVCLNQQMSNHEEYTIFLIPIKGPTSTNAAHLTTFFLLISAPSSQPCSLKPNSLLTPRVSLL